MVITIKRSGGFLGTPMTKTIDTTTLPKEKQEKIQSLLSPTEFFTLPSSNDTTVHADEFTYTISVKDTEKEHTIIQNEKSLSRNIKEIVALLWNS